MFPRIGQYDPKLDRVRTDTDDFYEHRKLVLDKIKEARVIEAQKKKGRK